MFCERPKRTRLRDRKPALGARPRGRLKWRQMLSKFGKHMSPSEHVCGTRCAARRECCSRSESRWRHRRARVRGQPRGAVRVRETSSAGIARHEGRVSNAHWLAWGIPRKRAVNAINGATLRPHVSAIRKGRANCKPPPWRCKDGRALPRVDEARPGCSEHPRRGQRSIS